MYIIIDGQKMPLNVKVTRDILITLKNMSRMLKWGILYDAQKEIIYINTTGRSLPVIPSSSDEETVSSRLEGKIICLDPGHGGSDPGAIGPTGTMEKDNTLAIALLLRDLLTQNGSQVVMTRETDTDVAFPDASASEELRARVAVANEAGADLFISIHNDAFTKAEAVGSTTFHYDDEKSIELAKTVQSSLVAWLCTNNRGARFASFYVLRYTNMPAILVEAAFISNPVEELLLASSDGRYNTAGAIFEGITKYYKV